jgi:hypothetical protein
MLELTTRTHTLQETKKKVFDLDINKQIRINPETGEQMQKEVVDGSYARMDVLNGDKKVGEVLISMHLLSEEEQEFFRSGYQKNTPVRFGV